MGKSLVFEERETSKDDEQETNKDEDKKEKKEKNFAFCLNCNTQETKITLEMFISSQEFCLINLFFHNKKKSYPIFLVHFFYSFTCSCKSAEKSSQELQTRKLKMINIF